MHIISLVVCTMIIASCGPGTGPDSLSSHGPYSVNKVSQCTACHTSNKSPSLDPVVINGSGTSGKHIKHVTDHSIDCEVCHLGYLSSSTHMNGMFNTADPAASLVMFGSSIPEGKWTNDTGPQTGSCSSITCHGADTMFWYGTASWSPPACTVCHVGALDPVLINGEGTSGKHVAHVSNQNIPCTKCHADFPGNSRHMSGHLDTGDPSAALVVFDTTNPGGTWTNDSGPQTGSCSSLFCHGATTLDWYGTLGWTTPAPCSLCHSSAIGTRRQVLGAGGDFAGNPTVTSHHIAGVNDPSREQCLVCHEQTNHMSGAIRLRQADTDTVITYDPAQPSSAEQFCLGCHDADGSVSTPVIGGTPDSPFNDGAVMGAAPYPYAGRISTSWSKAFGHGTNGNHAAGSRLTCLGTGQPATGCHGNNGTINAHGSVNQVLASKEFNFNLNGTYREADYSLCFNCHAAYPGVTKEDILGVKFSGLLDSEYGFLTGPNGLNGWNPPYYTSGVTTRFADHNEPGSPLNDTTFWGENFNLHWFHLGGPSSPAPFTDIVCVNCHDVHGSNTQYGAVYDELVYRNTTTMGSNIVGEMTTTAYVDSSYLKNYPTYCSFNCHEIQGPTKAWSAPVTE